MSGGKIEKSEIHSAVERNEKCAMNPAEEEERKAQYADSYNLILRFFEHGLGESIHTAPRFKDESYRESIKRHEHFLALQLGLKPGQKVLDVGCGFGAPLREIARFSSASITGLNINEYQLSRAKVKIRQAGLEKTCDLVQGDFMKMQFPDNTFEAAYAIEATCHASDKVGCYGEILRVLKPGQCFAAYECCMTDSYDPNNTEHQRIKAELEIGTGLADTPTTERCLEALEKAGFEIIWSKDVGEGAPIPWFHALDKDNFTPGIIHTSNVGRFFTKYLLSMLEFLGIAAKGSREAHRLLETSFDALVVGGKKGIFTTNFFFLVRKPL